MNAKILRILSKNIKHLSLDHKHIHSIKLTKNIKYLTLEGWCYKQINFTKQLKHLNIKNLFSTHMRFETGLESFKTAFFYINHLDNLLNGFQQ